MTSGIHDLGGMQGFGPVPVSFGQNEFPDFTEWEKRMWGLSMTVPMPGSTIDWFRHVVERMLPADYLTSPYFNKWCATCLVIMIDNGTITFDDLDTPPPVRDSRAPTASQVQAVVDTVRSRDASYRIAGASDPRFGVGQDVIAARRMPTGHTRLPGYVRGATGTVSAHHGCHPLPDQSARGTMIGEHLYSVRFEAQELWGPEANPRDAVALDLWESYLAAT